MKKSTVLTYDLARALYAAATFYWFFMYMIIISELQGVTLSPAVPALGMAAIYAAGYIATGRGIAFWHYVLLQAAVSIAGAVVLFWCLGYGAADLKLKISAVVAYLIASIVSAIAASAEAKPGALTIRFDCCVVMCTILLITGHYTAVPLLPYCMALLIVAMAAIAVSLTLMRADDRGEAQSAAGRALPFVILIVIGLISGAAYIFAAGGAKRFTEALVAAVKAVAGAIGAAITFLWTQWTRFCGWLARLFPERDIIPEPVQQQTEQIDIPQTAEPSRFGIIVAWVMTSLLVFAALAAIFFALRSIRLKRKKRLKLDNRKAVRRGGLSEGLKAALRRLAEKLRYKAACIRYRNTPAGLLAWCEAKVPRTQRCRFGESGPRFLLRLAEGRPEEEKRALTHLAALVESDFYAKEKTQVPSDLRSSIKRCRF